MVRFICFNSEIEPHITHLSFWMCKPFQLPSSSVASSLKTQTNVIEILTIFRNAKKNHRFVTVDPLRHHRSTSNLREEQLDQAWEIWPKIFPWKWPQNWWQFWFLSPKFGGEHVVSSPKKNSTNPPKIIPSDSVKMSSQKNIYKKLGFHQNKVLPNPHLLPRRLPFVQLDNSQRGAVGCDIRTSVRRVGSLFGGFLMFEDLGKSTRCPGCIWYDIKYDVGVDMMFIYV